MAELGDLKPYDLRRVWQYEDRHFTVWLADNLHRLGKVLQMSLDFRERERSVGPFSLDILAHDTIRDRPVVIENQLQATDHDHLGKLITYAAGIDARAIVWIAASFRDQHRAAIDWLNAHSDETVDFFGVELEAVQIDDSRPAVNFKVVASPNSWQRALSDQRSDVPNDSRRLFFYQFNEAMLSELRAMGTFNSLPSASDRYELVIQRTHGGIRYGTAFSRSTLRVCIWIVAGDREVNRQIFDALRSDAIGLEASVGQPIQWDYNADRLGQILTVNRTGVERDDAGTIPAVARWAAETLTRLKAALNPRLSEIVRAAAVNQPRPTSQRRIAAKAYFGNGVISVQRQLRQPVELPRTFCAASGLNARYPFQVFLSIDGVRAYL